MSRLSLGKKMIMGGCALVVIPLAIVGWFAQNRASVALEEQTNKAVASMAASLADSFSVFLAEEVKLAKDLAAGNATIRAVERVAKDGLEGAKAQVDDLSHKFATAMRDIGEDYESFFVTDVTGMVIADGLGGRTKGIKLGDREYFLQVKSTMKPAISQPLKSRDTGNPIAVIATPVPVSGGGFAGVCGVVLKLDKMTQKVASVRLGQTGYAFMVDKGGLFMVHPDAKLILETNIKSLKGAESLAGKMLGGQSGVEYYTFMGADKVSGYAPVPVTGWSVAVTQEESEFLAPVRGIRWGVLITALAFLVLAMGGVLIFVRKVISPIGQVVTGLSEASQQVSTAAQQVSSASSQLAEGSSTQAASLEQTSASLEELASMTKHNADNAQEAHTLTQTAGQTMASANKSMRGLTTSMGEISAASDEISKIIRTIDEIAFQTNLLALNAAVEAARAGEAGAGFAVVAEEVRNLAMRAGEAARNTAQLIEGTVHKVKGGVELVNQTNASFHQVGENAKKVGELVGEIAAASREQAQGIEQINLALNQMDKVTQSNAANAEQTASAAEEMNGQALRMRDFVDDLQGVVGRTSARQPKPPKRPKPGKGGRSQETAPRQALPQPRRPAPAKTLPAAPVKGRKPQDVIPLDDDFKDF